MCMETKLCVCLSMMVVALGAYMVLNETGKLDMVKRQCYNKAMDLKEDIKSKLD